MKGYHLVLIHLTLMGKNKSLLKECVISSIFRNHLFLFKFMYYNYSLIFFLMPLESFHYPQSLGIVS